MPTAAQSYLSKRTGGGHQMRLRPSIMDARYAQRGSAAARGYGARWRQLRLMVLRRNPICEMDGCHHVATDVDHIVPKREGGTDEMSNLQALCGRHHKQKTMRGT